MTQQGFENYLYAVYDTSNSRAARSYITAIRIIDEMFVYDDVFDLQGTSVTCVDDAELLQRIVEFVHQQQYSYQKGNDSIFRKISDRQRSYPKKGFCSAAAQQLLEYKYSEDKKAADKMIAGMRGGRSVSAKLCKLFDVDKEGTNIEISSTARAGQRYFREKILEYYGSKCCVTGLNIPTVLRASHISAWASDKANRMNPENGLCLSATYDAAFDKHLISFDDDYRMLVSKEIKEYYTKEVTKEYFGNFEGKKIILPSIYLPSKKLLEKHRELLVG